MSLKYLCVQYARGMFKKKKKRKEAELLLSEIA